ncbi:TRAP transporter large permease [Ruegeria jejuensis]|uniref:TRAP transporter large permease n=1 Tax=Ruegeria jejuensis TaxID=3233338 RepID=UPI00355BA72A
MTGFIGLATIFFGLSWLRQPLPLVLICCSIFALMVWGDGQPVYLFEDMWAAIDSPFLLSIPMFLVAGALMSRGSIAERLIEIIRALTEWMPGGLAVATILSCALFAAISGSSTVTMLAIGAILYPTLLKAGYQKSFALGALTSSGTLGIIIPPSIPLIIYGIVNEISIADLFLAALIPGLVLTLFLSTYAFAANRHSPSAPLDLGRVVRAFRRGIWAMMLPVVLLGGIYSGYFSPTESAAVAVGYAAIIEVFVHRELTLKDFWQVGVETSRLLGTLVVILAVIMAMQNLLTILGVQESLADWVVENFDSKIAFLLAINVLLLIVGCFIDVISAILILSPLLLGPAMRLGIDPLHFAVIMVVNLEIGLLTPPVGLNLFVAMSAFREKFSLIVKGTLPFVALMVAALLLLTFVPWFSLFLVR